MRTAQIGKCGELLMQYQLLMLEVESAHLTTDAGIDLVAYSPKRARPVTIQVKTNLQPKPSGGKGKDALDWWVPVDSPADYVAFVDLSTQRIWLLSQADVAELSQQTSGEKHHFCLHLHQFASSRVRRIYADEFEGYLLQNRARKVFSVG